MAGRKMRLALDYVTAHPGVTVAELCRAVGPYGSQHYGRAIINRAIAAGMLELRTEGRNTRVYPAPAAASR